MEHFKKTSLFIFLIIITTLVFWIFSSLSSGENEITQIPSTSEISVTSTSTTIVIPTTVEITTTTTIKYVKKTPVIKTSPKSIDGVGGVNAFLDCVGWHESGNRYYLTAGRYGILVSTWHNQGYAAKYGTSSAGESTPAQQDEAAMDLYNRLGARPWSTRSLCGQ